MKPPVRRAALASLFAFTTLRVSNASAQGRPPNQTNRVHMFSKPAVVRIYAGYSGQFVWKERAFDVQYIGSGSGFLIHPTGYILTNAHVVSDVKEGDEQGQRLLLQRLAMQVLTALGQPITQATVQSARRNSPPKPSSPRSSGSTSSSCKAAAVIPPRSRPTARRSAKAPSPAARRRT